MRVDCSTAAVWSARKRSYSVSKRRRTCAKLLLTKSVHPKIVSEMLGHSSIAITLDIYSHVIPGLGDVAATAMEDVLG
jgi:integrase